MDLFNWPMSTVNRLPKEDVEKVIQLTFIKEVYSRWESNDEGEDFELYKGFAADGITLHYFLKHFSRGWFGGWTYEDTTNWYEIPEEEYLRLYSIG